MATEKQIAANRRNAQRSTGPRTAAGKSISSRNALRHGLSLPQEMDAATLTALDELTREVVRVYNFNHRLDFGGEAAAAVLDLIRIRHIRTTMLATMDLGTTNPEQLQRLIALDRYERRARTKRRRASAKLRNG
jgi:hypothetical protein